MPHFLQLADISALVFAFLGVYDLLKLSMVCKAGRALVDSLSANAFAQATPFELHGWRCRQEQLVMELDAKRHELVHEYTLDSHVEAYRVLLHVHMHVGRLVPMSVQFHVPLAYVSGTPARKHFSASTVRIVVTCWRVSVVHVVTGVHDGDGQRRPARAVVRLEAVRFRVLDACGAIGIPFALVLKMHNTPLDNALTARERAVVRSCVACMNCQQRRRAFHSLDVAEKQHRVLCGACFSFLYTDVCKLHGTWKIARQRLAEVRGLHDVHTFMPAYKSMDFHKPRTVVLKEQMARALGFDSWAAFICNNHKAPVKYARGRARYCWGRA